MSATIPAGMDGFVIYAALGLAVTAAVIGTLLLVSQLGGDHRPAAAETWGLGGLPRILFGAGIALGCLALLQAVTR